MEIGFLITSYTQKTINNVNTCLSSIRNFYDDVKVVIVDNYSGGPDINLPGNTFYYKNENNSYEMGAIWYAIEKHPEVDRWVIIHDSCKFISEIPVDLQNDNNNFTPFWCDIPEHYAPTIPLLINHLKSIGIEYDDVKTEIWRSVCGLMCVIDKSLLSNLCDIGLDKIKPNSKIDAVCSEILFGLIITYINKESMRPIHDNQISTYINKEKDWVFIEKYTGGLKAVDNGTYIISTGSILHPSNNFEYNYKDKSYSNLVNDYFDIEDFYNHILKRVISDENAINEMVNTFPKYLRISDVDSKISKFDLVNLYSRVRHEVFNFIYFKDYFNKKYKEII